MFAREFPDAGLSAHARRSNRPLHARRRTIQRLVLESLETRALLASVDLTGTGPITRLNVGNDGSFQILRTPFTGGQFFPPSRFPGDGGIFLRTSDGRVFGFDFDNHPGTAAQSTNSLGSNPISQTVGMDGQSVTTVFNLQVPNVNNPPPLEVTQVVTLPSGADFFRVDNRIVNTGSGPDPVTFDFFAAADLFLADSDRGSGFFNPATRAVGGLSLDEVYKIFIQPNAGSGLQPTNFQSSFFGAIWQAIGTPGRNFDNNVVSTVTDNGAGQQWKGISLNPGESALISYFWLFGDQDAVPGESVPVTCVGTEGDDVINITIDPANPDFVTITINDSPPRTFPWAVNSDITVDGLGGNDVLNIRGFNLNQPLPSGNTNGLTSLTVNGGPGNDRINLIEPPTIPNLNMTLDGLVAPLNAAEVPSLTGDILTIGRGSVFNTDAFVFLYQDLILPSAYRLEYQPTANPSNSDGTGSFVFRNFGSVSRIVTSQKVTLLGDFGTGTFFGANSMFVPGSGRTRATGSDTQDTINAVGTAQRQFFGQINPQTATGPLQVPFGAPNLSLMPKWLADTVNLQLFDAVDPQRKWNVAVTTDGGDATMNFGVTPNDPTGDLLNLLNMSDSANDVVVRQGGGPIDSVNRIAFENYRTVNVVGSNRSTGLPDRLGYLSSTPSESPNRITSLDSSLDQTQIVVNLSANGVVNRTTFAPIFLVTGPGLPDIGQAVSGSNVDQTVTLGLSPNAGGRVVQILVQEITGSDSSLVQRNLFLTGTSRDLAEIIDKTGNARILSNEVIPGLNARRIIVAYPSGTQYTITIQGGVPVRTEIPGASSTSPIRPRAGRVQPVPPAVSASRRKPSKPVVTLSPQERLRRFAEASRSKALRGSRQL